MDALCLTYFQDTHKGIQCTRAAWETAIGIDLNQYFLDFIYGQPGIQSCCQCHSQTLLIAFCRTSADGCNLSFLQVQHVFEILSINSAHAKYHTNEI